MPLHIVPNHARLRAAVVGAGVFGRYHAGKYRNLQSVDLVGIADPSAQARDHAAAQFEIAPVADWRALVGKVDLVSVCAPAGAHAEIVQAFLESGAHVLVEKPFVTDLDDADALIALAAAKGLILTVGHQDRLVLARTGLLDRPDAPLAVEAVRAGPWSGRSTDVSVVLDLMIHDLDMVHQLLPFDLEDVRATGRSQRGVHLDEVAANLAFADGHEAKLFASRVAGERRRTIRLIYADGVVEFDFLTRTVRTTAAGPAPRLEMDDPLGDSIAAFVAAVEGGPEVPVRPEEARRALDTGLQIEEAAELGTGAGRAIRAPAGVALFA